MITTGWIANTQVNGMFQMLQQPHIDVLIKPFSVEPNGSRQTKMAPHFTNHSGALAHIHLLGYGLELSGRVPHPIYCSIHPMFNRLYIES
jgi:hypothetical protein